MYPRRSSLKVLCRVAPIVSTSNIDILAALAKVTNIALFYIITIHCVLLHGYLILLICFSKTYEGTDATDKSLLSSVSVHKVDPDEV